MTKTTKAVAWMGAIFGTMAVMALALIIGAMMYADYHHAEQQRQAQQALKQGLASDLKKLKEFSQDYLKPVDLNKIFSSPSPSATK